MEERNRESKHIIFSYYRISRTREFIESFRAERSWAALQERLRVRRRDRRRAIGRRLSAAAVAVLCLGGGLWTWQRPKAEEPAVRAEACLFPERGGQAAFLTLADGREIDLSEQEGEIEQGGASNLNRELSYRRSEGGEADNCTSFHTLTVPRGGEYRLMLADGSRVWMNAGSRLRYPERFGRSREVYLTGEAYFEVAKDSCRPFRVHTEDYGVEVLGTRFNVTAYADETGRATLAGGSIKVTRGGEEVVLRPNEQAVMREEGIRVCPVNADLYTSWVQGRYIFRNTELKDIVARLSRWFNVDIHFRQEELMHRRFAGIILRDAELEFAVEVISRVAHVRFVRDGEAIYIEQESFSNSQ